MAKVPIIAAATGGGGGEQPPPPPVLNLQATAERSLAAAEQHRDDLIGQMNADAEARYNAVDDMAGSIYVDLHNEAASLLSKAEKGRQVVLDDLFDRAVASLDASHDAVRSLGGTPYLMTDEAAGANMADSHFIDARDRLILPAIELQRAGKELTTDVPGEVPPPGPAATSPIPPPTPPAAPTPAGVPPGTDPTPPTDSTCPQGYVWGPDPATGIMGWVCVGGSPDLRWIPGEPLPTVPPPLAPPPASPPPPQEECPCPVPSLVIRMPGCVDVPVTTVPVVPSRPTLPPPASPPQGPPPPPVSPPPPPVSPVPPDGPKSGEPINPIGINEKVPSGELDGPNMCDRLTVLVGASELFQAGRVSDWTRQQISNVIGAADKMPVVGPVVGALLQGGMAIFSGFNAIIGSVTSQGGIPNPATATAHTLIKGVNGFMTQWFGVDASYYLQPLDNAARYANPTNILGQADADNAFLANMIDYKTWACLTGMNGNQPWQFERAMQGKRNRPGISEIVGMWYRQLIDDKTFYEKMRAEGVLSTQDSDYYAKLAQQLPTVTDLMRYMVKDSLNKDYVEFAGLMEDFEKSWTPELDAIAKMQGVTDFQIRAEYASQWQDTPPTQIYQFMWRLRPGRVPPELVFTEKDAAFALKIQEIAPKMRDRYIRVAYLPINRTDLMEGYKVGAFSEEFVYQGFQDLGYFPDDARQMTTMLTMKAEGQFQGSLGGWTRRTVMNSYIEGAITYARADELLSRTISDAGKRKQALADADAKRAAQGNRTCIRSVKRRYMTGEFDEVTARNRLLGLAVEQAVVLELMNGWTCEKRGKSKEPTVAMLKGWVNDGIITWDQFGQRLLNLGYMEDDVVRIRIATDLDERKRLAKEAEKASRQAKQDARQAAKDRAQAAKDQGQQGKKKPGG